MGTILAFLGIVGTEAAAAGGAAAGGLSAGATAGIAAGATAGVAAKGASAAFDSKGAGAPAPSGGTPSIVTPPSDAVSHSPLTGPIDLSTEPAQPSGAEQALRAIRGPGAAYTGPGTQFGLDLGPTPNTDLGSALPSSIPRPATSAPSILTDPGAIDVQPDQGSSTMSKLGKGLQLGSKLNQSVQQQDNSGGPQPLTPTDFGPAGAFSGPITLHPSAAAAVNALAANPAIRTRLVARLLGVG